MHGSSRLARALLCALLLGSVGILGSVGAAMAGPAVGATGAGRPIADPESVATASASVRSAPAVAAANSLDPSNRPTTVPGQQNGQLPAALLYAASSTCSLAPAAAGSFLEMVSAAHRDGVGLSAAECYRDYAGQVYQRNYWCGQGNCANAAVPGTSNHGWGKAADLRDQSGEFTWISPGYRWMAAHAGSYGFQRPGGVDEAWHWEWVGDGGTLQGTPIRPDLQIPPVIGAILAAYNATGGSRGYLGYPLTVERPAADGGRYNDFQNGAIYWTPATDAHAVYGAIRGRWAALGWERGLGYPLTNETGTPDGVGRYNHFTGGSIYWTPGTDAHEVHGAIREHWAVLGWEHELGYPMTDETATPDGFGRYNHFTAGSIYWSPVTAAHEVHGAIRQRWAALGWEVGRLGYPTSDEYAVPGGRRSDFVGGSAVWSAATGTVNITYR